jgi:hypothetical protein
MHLAPPSHQRAAAVSAGVVVVVASAAVAVVVAVVVVVAAVVVAVPPADLLKAQLRGRHRPLRCSNQPQSPCHPSRRPSRPHAAMSWSAS